MNIVLVGAELEENLSIRYIAGYLRGKGHRAEILPFNFAEDEESAVQRILALDPGLVGLSMVFQRRAAEFMRLAVGLRKSGYSGHITCGGHFPTFNFEEILLECEAIDSVIRGEGELTMETLAASLSSGSDLSGIGGLVFRERTRIVVNESRKPVEELDLLPFPARDSRLHLHVGIPSATIVGSRGCYGNCSFCCINAWHRASGGKKYRSRTPGNIVAEMQQLYHEKGVRIFIFHDDNFFVPRKDDNISRISRLGELFRQKGLVNLGLVVKARPDNVDRELFTILKEMGLIRVYLGIENNSPGGLKSLNRLLDRSANEKAIDLLKELSIYTCFNLLIFEPYMKPEDILHNIDFMERHRSVPHNFCRTECYTASALYHRLVREGRLRGNYLVNDYEIEDPRMELLFRIFARAFYERNFDGAELSNSNMSLGYNLHVLRRFYPESCTPGIERRVGNVTGEINLTGAEFLREAYDFVMTRGPLRSSKIISFTADLTSRIIATNYRLKREIEECEKEISEASLYGGSRSLSASPFKGGFSLARHISFVSALAMLVSATSCFSPTKPEVVDPLPPSPTPSVSSPTVVDPLPSSQTPSSTYSPKIDPIPSPSAFPTEQPVDPLPSPHFEKKEGSNNRGNYNAESRVKSIPRTLGGEIRMLESVNGVMRLKMEYCYIGASRRRDNENRAHSQTWVAPEGVALRWRASSGEVTLCDDGTVLWKVPPGAHQHVVCECVAPDGAVWMRSYSV